MKKPRRNMGSPDGKVPVKSQRVDARFSHGMDALQAGVASRRRGEEVQVMPGQAAGERNRHRAGNLNLGHIALEQRRGRQFNG